MDRPSGASARLDRRELLARLPLFAGLDAELDALLELTTTRKLAAREVLCRKGDRSEHLYVIAEGRLKAVATGAEGKEVVFALMEPGETIGEVSILEALERSATVVALEPTLLLGVQRRDLMPYLERHPRVALRLAELLARRLRRLSEHVEDTSFLGLPSRLAKKLLGLADSFGRSTDAGVRIDLRLPQQEIGEMVGTSRESINKQLRRWARRGIVSVEGGYVTVLDRPALEAEVRDLDFGS